jgi:hypothetical protein
MRSERNACSVPGWRWRRGCASKLLLSSSRWVARRRRPRRTGLRSVRSAPATRPGRYPPGTAALCSRSLGTRSGGPYADPYRDDKPLFTISAANVEQYRKQLTAGQIALLQKYPTWQMNVYPTRRSAAFPQPCTPKRRPMRRGKARARRQRRHGHEGRHSVSGAEGRPRGDLEHDCCAIAGTRTRRDGARRRSRAAGRTRRSTSITNSTSTTAISQAAARPRRQQARLRAARRSPGRKARRSNAAGGRTRRSRSAGAERMGLRPGSSGAFVLRRPSITTIQAPPPMPSPPAMISRCTTARPNLYGMEARGQAGALHPVQLVPDFRQRADDRGPLAGGPCQSRLCTLRTAPRLGRGGDTEAGCPPHLRRSASSTSTRTAG